MKYLIPIFFSILITTNSKSQIPNSQTGEVDSATMYLTGTFKPYNPAKAFSLFMQRATNGDTKAMNAVAIQYAKGVGVSSNFNAAVYWFRQAASNGYTKALVNLGMIYKHKAIDSTSYAIAFNIFDSALNLSEPSAIFAKGYMQYKGLGCTQSYTNALQLFKRGVDSNRADCIYFMGLCYSNGFGVLTNADSANFYITKAATLGYKQANAILAFGDTTPTAARGTKKLATELTNDKLIQSEFINIPITNQPINLNGTYTGFLTQYDYSGKKIIKQTKLTLNLINNNGAILGDWVQNDSIHLPLTAVQYNNSLVFDNMQIGKAKNKKQRGTPNEQLLFKSANFQYQKQNDTIRLMGNLQLFNNYQNEPDKPINITLLQQSKKVDSKQQEAKDDVVIYPNPFNNTFNVAVTMQQQTEALFTIYTQNGKQVFQQKQQLQKGKQNIPINLGTSSSLESNGTYILKIATPNETISRVIIKANQ